MISELISKDERFQEILERLNRKSVEDYYNPYRMFEWPDSLPENRWWMSPELTTTYGTEVAAELDQEQLYRLSRYESINFYSLNVDGIRDLIIEVTRRIHTRGFEIPSEFFHHFIGEENEHMWFFAEFCQRYGEKIYRQVESSGQDETWPEAASFLVFVRILLFEELVDHFNSTMALDERLHDTIRAVNRIHHQDESRHIAFGRELVSLLFEDLKTKASPERLDEIREYIKRYVNYSFESLFNPQVYRDAGIPEPFAVRRRLLASPRSAEFQQQVLRKPLNFLVKTGILHDRDLAPAGLPTARGNS
ncbi:AurF domain containing protein [Streptomyces kasugaensis]|uniref:AurF domain containing protein n=1 Tax=Streptomyces kasugaensis TaxID=1946 RepID=A0A4Q9HY00_STRKA|nr:diiron oxygenase [Streptomyces kasugaensis]TBO60154.1 AurF domain containing protein [Streptomyces kasugaensis]